MKFSKLEGLGNDFIVVNEEDLQGRDLATLARRVCDRHFALGADGLLIFGPSDDRSAFSMRIFNADGGEAELSGNGLRCLAAHLFHQGLHSDQELRIQTLAGLKILRMIQRKPLEYLFEVDMGRPVLERSHIPFRPDSEPTSLVSCKLRVGNEIYLVTITSMGNPHCSLFVDNFEDADWEHLGSRIEIHPNFPQRTNAEFIKVRSRREIEVRFWERGVGKTHASGTGSCAAVVASALNGYVEREVTVHTTGGTLLVFWRSDDSLQLTGPAKIICDGEIYL